MALFSAATAQINWEEEVAGFHTKGGSFHEGLHGERSFAVGQVADVVPDLGAVDQQHQEKRRAWPMKGPG